MEPIELSLQTPSPDVSIQLEKCIESANKSAGKGDETWRALWRDPMQEEHLEEIEKLVRSLQPCTNLLVLGIGGSALGTRSLHASLCSHPSVSLFILDNIDPHTFTTCMERIQTKDPTLSQTVVVVVSKSGNTAEIAALWMAVQSELQGATYIAITGTHGALHAHALQHEWEILPVPDGVGGRFSILSPVSLFPAAMCGIVIRELLDGAREMDDRCMSFKNNPAANLAEMLVCAMREGRNVQVLIPYCDRMSQFTHWYVQLWAESLGKIDAEGNRVGVTPVSAIGATDQHSMLQLWREGPADKVIGFLEVQDTINVPLGNTPLDPSQAWLCGESLGSLLKAEQIATEQAVRDAGQLTWKITLPDISSHSIGQFIALWQNTVAIAGRLLEINPYNQPGVELGKKLTRDAFHK